MATFKMQRARGDFGRVPVEVLSALVLSSREDIGAAYRRLDTCHRLAPGGLPQFAGDVRRYLIDQGLTPAEAQIVAEHVCGPRSNPAKKRKNPDTIRELRDRVRRAENAYQRARSRNDGTANARHADLVDAERAWLSAKNGEPKKRKNPEQGPVNILATYSAADAGKHPILDAALEIAELAKTIPVPHVSARVSQLGGPHRASAMITVGLDPRESWTNGIFENSRYARFDVSPGPQFSPYAGKSTTEPTIEMISGSGVSKFRKTRFKTPAEAIAKIAKWARESDAAVARKRNPVVRRHKTVAEMRRAGVPDYFEKIQERGKPYRPSTMLYETGEQRPVATHSGHYLLTSGDHAALMHRRPVGDDPNDTEYTVRGLYDIWGRRKNPATTVGYLLADVRAALPGWPVQPGDGRVIVLGARPDVARQRLVALGYNAKIVPANDAYGEPAHVVVSAHRNPRSRR